MSPRGRPPVGPKMELRLTLEQYAWLDDQRGGTPRPEMIRRLIDQAAQRPAPIVLDTTAETGDESSPVICQAHGQASPMYVCLREAEGEWRSSAEGRVLALCSEHGAYAVDEGWTPVGATPPAPETGQ